ncbi:Uncharacterised protein [Vibrio cholerae]|nr:Uncharacterised protein [Vibrio cholerae]
MFNDGTRHADDIALLKCIVTNKISGYVTGDHNHRNRVHIGGCNPSHRIGGART